MTPLASPLTTDKRNRGQIFVWTLFDFANTSFSVLIVAVGYTLYFKQVVVGGAGRGDFFWGLAVSISMLLTALVAPVLGAASDLAHNRKRLLFLFTAVSVICTALLYFVHAGMIVAGMILFIIANIGFEGGIVFYNAFLPLLTEPKFYGRISGYGFAMGYVGSLVSLMIAIPLFAGGFEAENLNNIRLSFVVAAAMFFIFSLPLFFFLRDKPVAHVKHESFVLAGFKRVASTITHIKSYKNIARFLVAFFVYNDGILTVIAFASIFAQQTLQFSLQEILLLFAVVQASAIIGSLVFGYMTDRIGPKKTIIVSLLCWLTVVVGAYFVESKSVFYLIGMVAGASMGGSQSASRTLMALLTPAEREAEFFGFYDGLCGKASAVIGTFMFGALSWMTGSQRLAVVAIGLFFVVGLALLSFVKDPFVKQRNDSAGRMNVVETDTASLGAQ